MHLLAAPDTDRAEGARDQAMMLLMARLSMREGEVCRLEISSIKSQAGRWTISSKAKGGRMETWPLPLDVKRAIDNYLERSRAWRRQLGTDTMDSYLFQSHHSNREFKVDRPLATRTIRYIVNKWADFAGIGKVSPHDLRRTAITHALKTNSLRQVQMMSKHRNINTLMRYDKDRENLEENAVNNLSYDEV